MLARAHGYRLTDEGYRLPPVRISRKEAFGFALARKLLSAFEGTPLDMEMRSVLGKIAESLEGEISVDLRAPMAPQPGAQEAP